MLGLGLLAGAVLLAASASGAQELPMQPPRIPPAPETPDTVRAPLARAAAPASVAIGRRLHWDREAIFATNVLTLQDLLDRIPGLTTFRSGWIANPALGAYLGGPRRIRVFYDGIAWDELSPRNAEVLDLGKIPLWTAEEVRIEEGATEIRVHIRTWRVEEVAPYTRTDVLTGDQNTNLYRGFFGRRFARGEALQVAAQQYSTSPPQALGAGSDQLSVLGRAGWASGKVSVDLYGVRSSRRRGVIRAFTGPDTIPAANTVRTTGYLRAAYGDPDVSPFWAQAVGSAITDHLRASPPTGAQPDTTLRDTTRYQTQYLLSVGANRAGFSATLSERIRAHQGARLLTPALQLGYSSRWGSAQALAEGRSVDSIARQEIVAVATPLSFLSILGAAGRASEALVVQPADPAALDSTLATTFVRGEVGLRIPRTGVWLVGGLVRRDSMRLAAPVVLGAGWEARRDSAVSGTTAAIRGRIYRDLFADVWAVRWNDVAPDGGGLYRPRYQARSEIFLQTQWLSRFPTGNFGLLASAAHEYRDRSAFPAGATNSLSAPYRTISTLLEIRIISAVLTWQFRNILAEIHEEVPGYRMPRQTNMYGVRWEFWN